ncbi:hypothetical protein O9929_13840 [Vibrio lentus]|nr:hypothetical protein [Vibrio lentus]
MELEAIQAEKAAAEASIANLNQDKLETENGATKKRDHSNAEQTEQTQIVV